MKIRHDEPHPARCIHVWRQQGQQGPDDCQTCGAFCWRDEKGKMVEYRQASRGLEERTQEVATA